MSAAVIQGLYQQGVQLAQAGWMYECMGNPMAAGDHYNRALGALEACGRINGVQPVDRHFWVGSCQLRLGYLCHLGGNFAWAQGWLNLALASVQQACRFDPSNQTYQALLGQLGQLGGTPAPGRPASNNDGNGPKSPVWDLLKKGLGVLPDLMDLFKKTGGGGDGSPGGMNWMNGAAGGGLDMTGGMGQGWTGGDYGMGGYGY